MSQIKVATWPCLELKTVRSSATPAEDPGEPTLLRRKRSAQRPPLPFVFSRRNSRLFKFENRKELWLEREVWKGEKYSCLDPFYFFVGRERNLRESEDWRGSSKFCLHPTWLSLRRVTGRAEQAVGRG